MWIVAAFGLAVCWATTILVNKQVLGIVTPLGANVAVRGFAILAEVAILVPLAATGVWPYGFGLSWVAAGWIAVNAVVTWLIAFNAYYYALRGGRVGVVAPIVSTDPLWTAVFAALMLGSALGTATVAGLVIAMAGVVLISSVADGDEVRGEPEVLAGSEGGAAGAAGTRRPALPVIALAVVAAAGWGLNPVFIELAENAHGSPSGGLIIESQVLGLLFLAVLIAARRSPLTSRRLAPGERSRVVLLLAAAGVLEAVFAVGFYLAIDQIGSLLTTLIVASSPVFSVAGGVLFLRERVGRRLLLGAGLTLAGVLLASAAGLL